jgi:hypothetical protein
MRLGKTKVSHPFLLCDPRLPCEHYRGGVYDALPRFRAPCLNEPM